MTKKINKITFLVIALISMGLMAWAVIVGMSAPESDKIADTMRLVGQYDENGEPVKDSLGKIVPPQSTNEGIESMKSATIHQVRHAEGLNYINTLNEIKDIDAQLVMYEADYNTSLARMAEIDTLKVNDPKAYKKDRKSLDEAYDKASKFVQEYNQKGFAELLKNERDWAARLDGVTGADFAKESAVVIDYMKNKKAGFEATLESYKNQLEESRESFDANMGIFTAAREAYGVEVVKSNVDPSNENSPLIEDYAATVDSYLEAVKKHEEAVKEDNKKPSKQREISVEVRDTLKVAKESVTDEVIASVKEYGALQLNIAKTTRTIETAETNIKTVEDAVIAAQEEGEYLMDLAFAISINIYWLYFLMVFAVVFVIAGFILNLIQNPNWIKIAIVVVVVAAVAIIAYVMAIGHGWNDGKVLTVLDANGESTGVPFGLGTLDSSDRYIFAAKEYMLADVSIWITYIAFVLAFIAAIFSWIWSSVNSINRK